MATWNWAESPGTVEDSEPRLRRSPFGDGYAQRAPDGINFLTRTWSLNFNEVTKAAGDSMVAFLRANAGLTIDWAPTWATAAIKVECLSWSRTLGDEVGYSSLQVKFREVFEP